jgi:hypothetical protein
MRLRERRLDRERFAEDVRRRAVVVLFEKRDAAV